jgi:beta-phosphoglucomutase
MPLNVQKVKWGHMTPPATASAAASSTLRAVGGAAAGTAGGGGGGGGTRQANEVAADARFAEWILGPAARVPKVPTRPGVQAVLFDLDGVLVDTAEHHYRAWQRLADELGLPFDREANHAFRGVGRMECLDKLLGEHGRLFAAVEKRLLGDRKNGYYLESIARLTPADVAAGALSLLASLRHPERGGGEANGAAAEPVRTAVVSASRNAGLVLDKLGIGGWLEVIIDGGAVTRGKPDPQGFLLAAERLRVPPSRCVVVEDAEAGIRAGQAAGMVTVAVGDAARAAPGVRLAVAGVHALTLRQLDGFFL